ncbi:MAG TPA: hypothetical protein DCW68_00915 [Rhodospirillaceae bacterium]|nr:MAG: hypothetical protein A2018_00695 [Alphaproteobacteria bacterium GWF2_58_20]HAU28661.1 hypothetical protein [Rhodospirillaceae bacterium]
MKNRIKNAIKTLLRRLLGMKLYEVFMATRKLGYIPHIRHPRSFNEKILHRKLYRWKEIPPQLADKWAVREHVAKTIGPQYLNEVYGVYERAEDIDFAKLPDSFVIKGTHGSALNIFVKNREHFDKKTIRDQCRRILSDRYGYFSNERWYLAIPPRLIVEKLIFDGTLPMPVDYRFFVFDSKVGFVEIDIGRGTNDHTLTLVTRNFDILPFRQRYPAIPDLQKPLLWDGMVALAEKIGAGWDAVRVDFYSPNQQSILFGEITFAHTAGWCPFTPDNADVELGKFWKIP